MKLRFIILCGLSLLLVGGCAKWTTESNEQMTADGSSGTRDGAAAGARGGAAGAARDGDGSDGSHGGPGSAARGAGSRVSLVGFKDVVDLKDVHFEVDRYDIRQQDADTLTMNARWLAEHPDHIVLIEGHCDERGTSEYNMALGDQRAKAVRNFLMARGVRSKNVTVISYGEDRPQCREAGEGCWSRNRRAHFVVKPR